MSHSYRLKLERQSLRLKVNARIPARLQVESPILLDTTSGVYTFSFDMDALLEILNPLFVELDFLNEPTQVTTSSYTLLPGVNSIAVNRVAPAATAITLPAIAAQGGYPIRIVDVSESVTDHTITITPHGSETIMRQATWPLYSSPSSLAGVTLWPMSALDTWIIAP